MNQQLSWRTIVGYSLGDVANNFAFAMGALFLLSYYTDVAGVGAAAAGTMLLLVRVFDAFADVFAGRVVDSVNTRWGKFRPFLLFGTAPLMIFSVLVFWVPTDWSHGSKVVYAYLTYMGLGLCYSLVNIPYGSLATAMTQQPQSRARLGAARGIAASLTFVCLAFLIGPSIKNSSPEEMVSVYHFWTIVLAIAGMVLYFICFKSTRENVVRIVAQPSLNISLQTLKRNRPLFMLCIGALCVLISTFAVSASSLFYVRYVLNDTGLFTVLVLVQNLVGTVASAPLVPGMVARIGKKNTFLIGALLGTCGYLLFFWVSVWSLPVALVALAIASIGQGVTMTVMWALEADTVEYGEYLRHAMNGAVVDTDIGYPFSLSLDRNREGMQSWQLGVNYRLTPQFTLTFAPIVTRGYESSKRDVRIEGTGILGGMNYRVSEGPLQGMNFFLAADKGREKRDGSTLGDRLNYWDVKMSIQYDFMLK
ncbi:TPA: glucuronide transporter [Escherichia coli]